MYDEIEGTGDPFVYTPNAFGSAGLVALPKQLGVARADLSGFSFGGFDRAPADDRAFPFLTTRETGTNVSP